VVDIPDTDDHKDQRGIGEGKGVQEREQYHGAPGIGEDPVDPPEVAFRPYEVPNGEQYAPEKRPIKTGESTT
jgi:hypothetical protein